MAVSERRAVRRAAGFAARRGLAGEQRRDSESALCAHLLSVELSSRSTVGVFIADDGEPDMTPVFTRLRDQWHQLALPVLSDDPTDFRMRFRPWLEADELSAGRYGIPVPPPRDAIEPTVILVPLVAFDSAGNRMGRGAGFYDRFLATSAASTIGVAFEAQRLDDVASLPQDVALRAVVTELGVRFMPTGLASE